MSTDFYLVSPSRRRAVQVGSVGLSGIQTYPGRPEAVAFVKWAIDDYVMDIVMVDEHRYYKMMEDAGEPDEADWEGAALTRPGSR